MLSDVHVTVLVGGNGSGVPVIFDVANIALGCPFTITARRAPFLLSRDKRPSVMFPPRLGQKPMQCHSE